MTQITRDSEVFKKIAVLVPALSVLGVTVGNLGKALNLSPEQVEEFFKVAESVETLIQSGTEDQLRQVFAEAVKSCIQAS